MAAWSAALKIKTKLEEFVRNQKDALSAEVKNIIEKARSDLQELVDEVTGDLQSSAHDLESKITKIEKQHETLKKGKRVIVQMTHERTAMGIL
jgi:division protein CdvB (Snf7/Vps24/ESCRT-III family)